MTATATSPTTTSDDWNAQFTALKARFPKVKDSIAFAIHALQQNPDVSLEDLKAQAHMHGIRVTASSVAAAQRLLASAPDAETNAATPSKARARATPRRTRRPRALKGPLDVESLIRTAVTKIQGQSATEAEHLRDAIRKAIAVLTAAVGA